MTTETANPAQLYEESRDLTRQLGNLGLDSSEMAFFILKETSPPRRKIPLWSMEDGSRQEFLAFRVQALIDTGRWTSHPEKAPKQAVSTFPCFLAPDSEIREELDALGIAVRCNSKHPSKFAMELVAAKKHPNSWKAWQAHLNERERKKYEDQQAQQVAAMMTLAQNATGGTTAVATALVPCDQCDFEAKNAFGLQAHKRNKHGGE